MLEEETTRPELDISELRRVRIERLEGSSKTRCSTARVTMASHSRSKESQPRPTSHEHRKKSHHRSSDDSKHRTRKSSVITDEGPRDELVYGGAPDRSHTSTTVLSETRRLGKDGGETKLSRHSSRGHRRSITSSSAKVHEAVHRSKSHSSRRHSVSESIRPSSSKRSSSRDRAGESHSIPRRSSSTRSHSTAHRTHSRVSTTASGSDATGKHSTILGSFFGPPLPTHHEHPVRL